MRRLDIYIYSILSFTLCLYSCNDFLSQLPTSEISEYELPKDSNSVVMLLNSSYNGLQAAVHTEWAATELRSDNAQIHFPLTSASSYTHILELDVGQNTTINPFTTEYWEATYNNIYRCNYAIKFIKNIEVDYLAKNTHLAELRTIRAYHYFNLVRVWGPIFLVTEPITGSAARYMQRESLDKIYDFIENELNDVINSASLPIRHNDEDLGRVNDLFPKSLLAKMYITRYQRHEQEYLKAKVLLEEVIDAIGNPKSHTELVPYNEIFSINNEMNDEIIFAIRFKSGSVGLGSTFGNDFAPTNSGASVIFGQGKSYNYPTQSIVDAFESGDIRKDITLKERYYDIDKEVWIENNGTNISRYVCKFLSPVTMRDDADNDFPVMRVGDVLLLYAEILNETGDLVNSLNYLNMIRQRAGLEPHTLATVNNSYAMRELIRDERRVELAFENQRWFDLMRWGIAPEVLNAHFEDAASFYDKLRGDVNPHFEDWNTILPLPLNVMTINPELPQNYGY